MLDLHSLKKNSTPQEFANLLLSRGPIFWSEPEKFWVITDHTLAQTALKHPMMSADRRSFFQAQMSGCPFHKVANFFGVVKNMMVNSDGAEHAKRRALAQSGVHDHILDGFESQVKKVVSELVASLDGLSQADFVEQIALPLPNILLADLFRIPEEQRRDFYSWANHMTQFFGGGSTDILSDAEKANEGAAQLQNFFTQMIARRRKKPHEDFIGHMVQHGGELQDEEIISQAAIMLVAGSITTTDQICNNLYGLLHSGAWQSLRQNPENLTALLEEATRLDPAVNFIFRSATDDFMLGTTQIKKNDLVFVSNHAVNRTAEVFPQADEIFAGRVRNPHMGYGFGAHYCLGAKLGRMQMRELFSQMLTRFPGLSLNPAQPALRKHQSLGFSGFENMSLVLGEL